MFLSKRRRMTHGKVLVCFFPNLIYIFFYCQYLRILVQTTTLFKSFVTQENASGSLQHAHVFQLLLVR